MAWFAVERLSESGKPDEFVDHISADDIGKADSAARAKYQDLRAYRVREVSVAEVMAAKPADWVTHYAAVYGGC